MSITPMEHSAFQMRKSIELQPSALQRQPSFGSEDDAPSRSEARLHTAKWSEGDPVKESDSWVGRLVENIFFQVFITLMTMASLFLYDIKTIFLTKQEDFAVGVANLVFLAVFLLEIALNIRTEGYFCSFFFYLDLISTVTILLDVDFLTDSLYNSGTSGFQVSSLVARSKASRVAARGVRVVKIFRLARVAKLYKSTQKARELNQLNLKAIREKENERFVQQLKVEGTNEVGVSTDHANPTRSCISRNQLETRTNIHKYQIEKDTIKEEPTDNVRINERSKHPKRREQRKEVSETGVLGELGEGKESRISKMLSEDTIKKIVIIILLIMVSIPLMDFNNYVSVTTQWDYMTSLVATLLNDPQLPLYRINQLINLHSAQFSKLDVYSDLLCIDTPFDQISPCSAIDFSSYRSSDLGLFYQNFNVSQVLLNRPDLSIKEVQLSEQSSDSIVVFVSYQRYNRLDSGFSMLTTLFVCLTIIYLLTSFSDNIGQLIITPIEKMLQLVRTQALPSEPDPDQEDLEEYQTQLVQHSIIRIKILMETIFGALGNQLVHQKLFNNRPLAHALGQTTTKSFCVLSLCQIRNFTRITEFLSEDVFGFFNEISNIVHTSAFRYGGHCTKILDDGFLLVFKVPPQECSLRGIEEDMDPSCIARADQSNTYVRILCDFALFAVLKILARLCKEPKIFKYRNDQRLLVNFGGVFNIEMNFALTLAWTYEGVVGSSYKIDPIFLGERLNQLEKTMRLASLHPNAILLSESLFSALTPAMRPACRPLEVIKYEESAASERVYVLDCDISNVTASRNRGEKNKKESRDLKTKKEMNMVYLHSAAQMANYNATFFINSKKELREILKKTLSEQSRRVYHVGFEKYAKGEWADSQQALEYDKLKNDPLAQRLYSYMQQFSFKCPLGWKGYRNYADLI